MELEQGPCGSTPICQSMVINSCNESYFLLCYNLALVPMLLEVTSHPFHAPVSNSSKTKQKKNAEDSKVKAELVVRRGSVGSEKTESFRDFM